MPCLMQTVPYVFVRQSLPFDSVSKSGHTWYSVWSRFWTFSTAKTRWRSIYNLAPCFTWISNTFEYKSNKTMQKSFKDFCSRLSLYCGGCRLDEIQTAFCGGELTVPSWRIYLRACIWACHCEMHVLGDDVTLPSFLLHYLSLCQPKFVLFWIPNSQHYYFLFYISIDVEKINIQASNCFPATLSIFVLFLFNNYFCLFIRILVVIHL